MAYAWVFSHLAPWHSAPDSAWTWIWSFIAFDSIYYWAHRWSHEINFLWAVHAPHHQSEEFNLTTALRQGAFQDALHAPLFMLLALLGCPPGVFIIQLTLSKFYQFWIHTRLVGRVPLIEGILNTPSAHRVHHAVNDVYLDRNYGATLMQWDRHPRQHPRRTLDGCRHAVLQRRGGAAEPAGDACRHAVVMVQTGPGLRGHRGAAAGGVLPAADRASSVFCRQRASQNTGRLTAPRATPHQNASRPMP